MRECGVDTGRLGTSEGGCYVCMMVEYLSVSLLESDVLSCVVGSDFVVTVDSR